MINGCEYFIEEHGTGRQTVVMAHDVLMSGRAFNNQFLALRDRYRCVEFDFRGHGRSSAPGDRYDLNSLASDLVQLVESGGYTPMHFVGSGMGAMVGLRIALRRPELLRSMVLLGASADAEPADQRRRLKSLGLAARIVGIRPFVKRIMHAKFATPFLEDSDRQIQVNHWRNEMLKMEPRAISRALRAYADRDPLDDQLAALRVPTLLLIGEHDRIVDRQHVTRLNERIANSRRIVIPGAGHCPAVETPEEVNQALMGFLGALQRG
jgi:pimeloyl-ACP methyl ester carboxylesterase